MHYLDSIWHDRYNVRWMVDDGTGRVASLRVAGLDKRHTIQYYFFFSIRIRKRL